MSRRWKIGIAVGLVGMAWALAWALLSDPNRGVAVVFLSYETNATVPPGTWLPRSNNGITARLCLTNGSSRAIVCETILGTPVLSELIKTGGRSSPVGYGFFGGITMFGNLVLQPAQSTCFSVPIPDLNHPVRVTVPYSTNVPPLNTPGWAIQHWGVAPSAANSATNTFFTTLKSRVAGWLHWKHAVPSVSVTIQER